MKNQHCTLLTLPLAMFLFATSFPPLVAEAKLPPLPLSTRGARIVDADNNRVVLRGVSWFGMETETHTPHGLWARDYKEMLKEIRQAGFNLIRLPFSVKALNSKRISGVNFTLGSNKNLQGKTPLQVMDYVVREAARNDLMILLDCHRLNDSSIPELWYDNQYTEKQWIDTWTLLANRYRNQANVIGADLKNEPHGRATWGTGDRSVDWRLAAERCGAAILKVHPNWLIVVEGVEKNAVGQRLPGHWWGGNLEGVATNPVRLPVKSRLVYSPHEYGPGVHNANWFSAPDFPENLLARWKKGFFYIHEKEIAPLLIGEFGGRKVDNQSKEGIWQRKFVRFIQDNEISFVYWCWNPNSGDTGGILRDDWRALDQGKLQLLDPILAPFHAP